MATGNKRKYPVIKVLPVDSHKNDILDHISSHRVTCIQGETGSGKSTRVPQYLVQHFQSEKLKGVDSIQKPCIIITQPRRIAAKSLAKRVAQEMGETDVGGIVGYKIGQDQKAGDQTMICYVTSGYLIELLVHNPASFDKYTHIILDEIHERDLDADLLSLMIKLLMKTYTHCKLVIMSATLQAKLFLNYFCDEKVYDHWDVKDRVLTVGVESPYNVETVYIESIIDYCEEKRVKVSQEEKIMITEAFCDASRITLENMMDPDFEGQVNVATLDKMKTIATKCGINKKNVSRVQKRKPFDKEAKAIDVFLPLGVFLIKMSAEPKGSILVFLPGITEIEEMYDKLYRYEERRMSGWKSQLKLFQLHSKMPHEDQHECFDEPPENVCHVILATNIAESSITLPKVNVVIDFCQRRFIVHDQIKRMSFLQLKDCSKASMAQRKGRTGRVCDGVCFRITTDEIFQNLNDFDTAEMHLAPLEKLVLQVKYVGDKVAAGESPSKLLSQAVEPPDPEHINTAVKTLADIGALSAEDESSEVTLLGKFCMDVPLDLNLCRLVFFGLMFKCPADAIIMAAALQNQDPFKQPSNKILRDQEKFIKLQKKSCDSRRKYDDGSYSEPIMCRNLIKAWCKTVEEEQQTRSKGGNRNTSNEMKDFRVKFAFENDVHHKQLKLIETMINDVGYAVMKWLSDDSRNLSDVKALIGFLPLKKKYFLTGKQKEISIVEEVETIDDILSSDYFILKMVLAAAFVPKFMFGIRDIPIQKPSTNQKIQTPAISENQRLVKYMKEKDINAKYAVCIPNPPVQMLKSYNEDILYYMIKSICLNSEPRAPPTELSKYAKVGSDQLFLEFKPVMEPTEEAMTSVTNNVMDPIVNIFHFTEGVSGKNKKLIYHLTRESDIKENKGERSVEMGIPKFPLRLQWRLLSSNGPAINSQAFCSRNRNPVGFVCDVDDKSHYGVCVGVTAGQQGTLCWVDGVTLFPTYKQNLFAVLAMLAFIPHQHGINFTVSTKDMVIAQVHMFEHTIPIYSSNKLTLRLMKIINRIRREVSDIFSDTEAIADKEIPESTLQEYFNKLMKEMEKGSEEKKDSKYVEPEKKKYTSVKLQPLEKVDGFYCKSSSTRRVREAQSSSVVEHVYLKPYNLDILYDKTELTRFVKIKLKTQHRQRRRRRFQTDSDSSSSEYESCG